MIRLQRQTNIRGRTGQHYESPDGRLIVRNLGRGRGGEMWEYVIDGECVGPFPTFQATLDALSEKVGETVRGGRATKYKTTSARRRQLRIEGLEKARLLAAARKISS